MATYDIVMAVILTLGIVQGAWRGMAWQLAPIASLTLGYVVAYPLSDDLAPWFGDRAPTNQFLALLVLFLAVSLAVYLVARMLKDAIVRIRLESYDRHLGSILGGVKALLLCLIVTFFAVGISSTAREHIFKTHSGHVAAMVMNRLHPVMPPAMHDLLHDHIHSLDGAATNLVDVHPGEKSATPTEPASHAHDPDHQETHAHDGREDANPVTEYLGPALRLADKLINEKPPR